MTRSLICCGLMALLLCGGCQSTYRAKQIAPPCGFLVDYSQLKPGGEGRALLLYIDTQVQFARYTKIMLDPVLVYAGPDDALGKLPTNETQMLVNYLDATLRSHLTNIFTIVSQPGPDVLLLRIAITQARSSPVIRDLMSSVVPFTIAASALKRVTMGSNLAVGMAGIEAEGLDALTGQLLFAVVDAQIGKKVTGKIDKFDAWHAVQEAFDFWAERFQDCLYKARTEGKLC